MFFELLSLYFDRTETVFSTQAPFQNSRRKEGKGRVGEDKKGGKAPINSYRPFDVVLFPLPNIRSIYY